MWVENCPHITYGETNLVLNPRTKSVQFNPRTVLGLWLQPQNVLVFVGLQHAHVCEMMSVNPYLSYQCILNYMYTLALTSWEFRSPPKFIYYKCGILPRCQDGIIKTKVKARDWRFVSWGKAGGVAKFTLYPQICSTFTVQKSWWEPWVILLAFYTLCYMSSLSNSSLWALNRHAEPNNHRQAASYKCSFWE